MYFRPPRQFEFNFKSGYLIPRTVRDVRSIVLHPCISCCHSSKTSQSWAITNDRRSAEIITDNYNPHPWHGRKPGPVINSSPATMNINYLSGGGIAKRHFRLVTSANYSVGSGRTNARNFLISRDTKLIVRFWAGAITDWINEYKQGVSAGTAHPFTIWITKRCNSQQFNTFHQSLL